MTWEAKNWYEASPRDVSKKWCRYFGNFYFLANGHLEAKFSQNFKNSEIKLKTPIFLYKSA